MQNEPFKLPQFAKSKDRTINEHTEAMNSNMFNKNNKMISIDGIRERSENRKNLISEQRIDVQLERANDAIEEIFKSNHKRMNLSNIHDLKKSKLKLKDYDSTRKKYKNANSIESEVNVMEPQDAVSSNLSSQIDMTNMIDRKIQAILKSKGPGKGKPSKYVKFDEMQKLSKSKNKIPNSLSIDSIEDPHLPDLTKNSGSLSPKIASMSAISNNKTPASPPTSKKITLETMLFGENPKEINPDLIEFLNHDTTKLSVRKNGPIKGYAANTNQGILRDYNEDRVSIILNVAKPESKKAIKVWPKIAFFGVFDGHGGASCAEFLRDNLHTFIIKDQAFPEFPKHAIRNGFKEAE